MPGVNLLVHALVVVSIWASLGRADVHVYVAITRSSTCITTGRAVGGWFWVSVTNWWQWRLLDGCSRGLMLEVGGVFF